MNFRFSTGFEWISFTSVILSEFSRRHDFKWNFISDSIMSEFSLLTGFWVNFHFRRNFEWIFFVLNSFLTRFLVKFDSSIGFKWNLLSIVILEEFSHKLYIQWNFMSDKISILFRDRKWSSFWFCVDSYFRIEFGRTFS